MCRFTQLKNQMVNRLWIQSAQHLCGRFPIVPNKSTGIRSGILLRFCGLLQKPAAFGRPKFAWKVNGHSVISGGTISNSTIVYVDDPTNPSKRQKTPKGFSVLCEDGGITSTWSSMKHDLLLYSSSYSGHIPLLIEAEVTEQSNIGGSVTGSNLAMLDTQKLTYDPPYDSDRERCKAAWVVASKHLVEFVHLPKWTLYPDPPPNIIRTAELIRQFTGGGASKVQRKASRAGY